MRRTPFGHRAFPLLLAMTAACLPPLLQAGTVERDLDPRTGAERVQVTQPGFSLRLLPLNRDYVVAVFSAKGLPPEAVAATRDFCTFGTILRNTGKQPLHYDLTDWRYITPDGRIHRIRTKTQWTDEWAERGVPFRWVLLHEEQTYQPGDWGQGFTTVALPAGSHFDLHYSWTQGEERHEDTIEDVKCAPATAPSE